jgi:hypothetical protein
VDYAAGELASFQKQIAAPPSAYHWLFLGFAAEFPISHFPGEKSSDHHHCLV